MAVQYKSEVIIPPPVQYHVPSITKRMNLRLMKPKYFTLFIRSGDLTGNQFFYNIC